MSKFNSIFLTGFRASGKSSVAQLLAKDLNLELVEMDDLIQKRSGKSINELTNNGQSWFHFRLLETEILLEYINQKNIVVSCGGGVGVNNIKILEFKINNFSSNLLDFYTKLPKKPDTFGDLQRYILKSNLVNLVILLEVSQSVLVERLKKDYMSSFGDHRPVLDDLDTQDIEAKIQKDLETYNARKPLYQELSNNEITDLDISNIIQKITEIYKV